MARRSRRGAFDDLQEIATKLPWQFSIGLAIVAFVVMHAIAGCAGTQAIIDVVADQGRAGDYE